MGLLVACLRHARPTACATIPKQAATGKLAAVLIRPSLCACVQGPLFVRVCGWLACTRRLWLSPVCASSRPHLPLLLAGPLASYTYAVSRWPHVSLTTCTCEIRSVSCGQVP
jgi:hypothetical protein